MLALFSSSGYLQIAINRGDAGSLLGLKPDTTVLIEDEESGERRPVNRIV
jgi:S-adenosylmethionine hydrolase